MAGAGTILFSEAGNCPQGPGGTILSSSFTACISLNSSLSRQPVARHNTSLTHQVRAPEFKAECSPSIAPALLAHPPSYRPVSFHQTQSLRMKSNSSLHSCWLLKKAAIATDANKRYFCTRLAPALSWSSTERCTQGLTHVRRAGRFDDPDQHFWKARGQRSLGLCHPRARVPLTACSQPGATAAPGSGAEPVSESG